MNKTKIVNGKEIHVFDDLTSLNFRMNAHNFITRSTFKMGFADNAQTAAYPYMCSAFSRDDVERMGLFKELEGSDALKLVNSDKLERAIVNLSYPTEPHWCHTHENQTVLLYYANPYWQEEHGGETLFMSEDLEEIEFASIYKPGRVIVFDGEIPHTIRPQSILAPTFRFSVSLFFQGSLRAA